MDPGKIRGLDPNPGRYPKNIYKIIFSEDEQDPSTQPKVRPTFVERSRSEMKRILILFLNKLKKYYCETIDGLSTC